MKSKILKTFIVIVFSLLYCNVAKATKTFNYVNSRNVVMTELQLETLKNLGFLEHEIENMTQEEFDKNKNLEAELVAQETKYYKTISYIPVTPEYLALNETNQLQILYYSEIISEEEYNNPNESEISPQESYHQDIVNTEYKEMTASISYVDKSHYRYKNSLKWKKEPKYRSYDIIAIGKNVDVSVVPSSKTFNMSYIEDDKDIDACFSMNTTEVYQWKTSNNGVSALIKLPSDTLRYKRYNISMYLYYDVQKHVSYNLYTLDAYGNYRHAQKNITITPSFDFGVGPTGDISFGASVSVSVAQSYDSISTSHATVTGINW